MTKVNLTYFRESGKYYSAGTYESSLEQLYEIWEEVRQMLRDRRLPGLVQGHSAFVVHVDVEARSCLHLVMP